MEPEELKETHTLVHTFEVLALQVRRYSRYKRNKGKTSNSELLAFKKIVYRFFSFLTKGWVPQTSVARVFLCLTSH